MTPKPGIATSEFIGAMIIHVVMFLSLIMPKNYWVVQVATVLASFGAQLKYDAGRVRLKMGKTDGP